MLYIFLCRHVHHLCHKGIKPGGASYVLMNEDSWYALRMGKIYNTPFHVSEFASLSPIWFRNFEELMDKLKTYHVKKNNRAKAGTYKKHIDISEANPLGFFPNDGERNPDLSRAHYEYNRYVTPDFQAQNVLTSLQRLLWHLLEGRVEPELFGLYSQPHIAHARVKFRTLMVNYWMLDSKATILDLATQEIDMDAFKSPYSPRKPVEHYRVEENSLMMKPGQDAKVDHVSVDFHSLKCPQEFVHGKTTDIDMISLGNKVRDWTRGSRTEPLVILTFNYDADVEEVLKKGFFVETLDWKTDLSTLLGVGAAGRESRVPASSSRRRSMSPQQLPYDDPRPKPRSPPPVPASNIAPVYVIDLQEMFKLVARHHHHRIPINEVARRLGIREHLYEGWNSGNECL